MKVLKIIFFCSGLLSSVADATDNKAHFYLGANMGYERQKEEFISRYTAPTLLPVAIVSTNEQSQTLSDRGTLLGLLGGWQYRYQRVLLGIEGHLEFADFYQVAPFMFSVSDQVNTDIFTASIFYKRGPVLEATMRLGYFVTPGFLPYLRFGIQRSRDEAHYQVFIQNGQLVDISEQDKIRYGGVGAIGVEFPTFIGASSLRFEYVYSRSSSLTISDQQLPILGEHTFRHPTTNAAKVAWVWNFL